MCGICGSTNDLDGTEVARMNACLVHRGPDDEGSYRDAETGVSLAARRLSIIDVEGGHQPVANEDRTIWAALNGEIYNHPELRRRLLELGHRFRSGTDTEVLVHLYEEYGDALLHALDGMFAFAIWDTRRRRLLIARDRFGEKPLFYHEHDGQISFASELTALLQGPPIERELDLQSVDAFFVLGYVPGPETMVRGVRQLPPAHQLVWQWEDRRTHIKPYWQPSALAADVSESPRQLADEAARLLRESVRSRMIADVPLGVLLSGGIDSSLIAVLAAEASSKPIKTFTVGYDVGAVAETTGARRTAREIGSDHHELILREVDVSSRAVDVLAALDQPLADQALIPTHAITEFARREVTVAVGGEGADELFSGYPRYRWLHRAARLERLPSAPRRRLAAAVGRIEDEPRAARLSSVLAPQPTIERHLDWVTAGRRHCRTSVYGRALRAVVDETEVPVAVGRAARGLDTDVPASVMRLDQVQWLPDDVLFKADRASMLNSLELRTPFLHRDLAEFAASVPATLHDAGEGKRLLRTLGADLGISAATRAKTAFRVPAADWLRDSLRPVVEDQLRSGAIYAHDLIDRTYVARIFEQHQSGGRDWTNVLWPLLALGLWVDRFWAVDAG